ncbi:hypothetical protein M378DRAFT_11551 [Amanita muscaria Koide BX008]|uniref:Uncharacterized protein n=1 Tax=Amanita muscaria (strain Koide BX008) TaxID=946122 RepID=A0A0C2SM87_AMAMK|nr:hypothetical protein M378DRAFT_11551 [Amanita muscaria Koide BX008]
MAAEFNVTVDDTHSSISYHPLRSWSSHCHTTDGAYNRTWHEPVNAEVGRPPTISMSVNFIGTALYLYSLPGRSPSPSGLTYNLDGQSISSLSTYSADSPVFAHWNLPNTPHKLIVEVDPASTFPFDYLIYTTAAEPIPSLLVQARQAAGDNSTISSSSDPSSTSSPPSSNNDPNSSQTQIGAIAYAVAASVGITSLFSIGLAVSIIKIRRQRHRVRRERQGRNRSRGLTIHLPPASVSASTPQRPTQLPRYSADTSASVELPSYDAVIGPTGRNSITPGQGPYVTHSRLATISEVATVLSMSQLSISTRRDPSTVREDSLEGMPPSPPGLGEQQPPPPTIENLVEPQNQSSTSQHPGVRSDHDA